MDPAANTFVPERVRAVIRYVMNPSSDKFNPSVLKWETTTHKRLLYRGQCDHSTKNIPRVGNNPLEISLERGKPISTSEKLTDKIRAFSCKPGGRLFEIHVVPGVKVAVLRESLRGYDVNKDEVFQFLSNELPDSSAWKTHTLAQLRATFFRTLSSEREVLLDPSAGRFLKESGDPEDWHSPEVNEVYVTGFFPKKGGRRRTLRSNLKKRTRRRSKWRQTSS
jgi:hypothetical protein